MFFAQRYAAIFYNLLLDIFYKNIENINLLLYNIHKVTIFDTESI